MTHAAARKITGWRKYFNWTSVKICRVGSVEIDVITPNGVAPFSFRHIH